MTRLLRPESVFFLCVWLILLLAFRERGFYDPGSLWHVKVGEIILDTGMPQTDPFSYTFEGQRWVPQQWGAEVLMALTHWAGGFDTLLLAFATGIALLATLIFRRCLQGGMGWPLAALVVGGCLFVGAFHYYVRPHMFTIALMGWTMMCIVDFERGRCGLARLAWLIPLYVVWTNLHGGVLGGTLTLGLAVAGWGGLFLVNGRSPIPNWRTLLVLCGIVLACGLTPFVNPHGLEMLRIWQRIVGSKVLPQVVHEHMPLEPTEPLGLAVIGLGVFYLVMLAGTLPRLPHVSWLIPLVWFALSFKGIRQAPLFAVVAAVALADLWPHTLWHRLLVKYGDGSLARERPPVATGGLSWIAIPALAVVLALSLQLNRIPVPVIGHGWARLDPRYVPVDLNDAVLQYAASVPPGTRIFNDANFGGYLIYHAPTLKIFMDDRCELYGDANIQYFADTLGLPPDEAGARFEAWAAAGQFDRALIRTNLPNSDKPKPSLECYLLAHPENWREVARGQRAVLFERVR